MHRSYHPAPSTDNISSPAAVAQLLQAPSSADPNSSSTDDLVGVATRTPLNVASTSATSASDTVSSSDEGSETPAMSSTESCISEGGLVTQALPEICLQENLQRTQNITRNEENVAYVEESLRSDSLEDLDDEVCSLLLNQLASIELSDGTALFAIDK